MTLHSICSKRILFLSVFLVFYIYLLGRKVDKQVFLIQGKLSPFLTELHSSILADQCKNIVLFAVCSKNQSASKEYN